MLERLIIENIALIEKLDIDLSEGFTVLTGETGAGKSIIIDGVNLVLGGRSSREMISYGKQKARVEAVFDISDCMLAAQRLKDAGLECEGNSLILMREITSQGKSICRINGEIVQLAFLKSITDYLVDVHGQHEHQSLLDEKNHITVIDAYMASDIVPLVQRVNTIYNEYSDITSKLNEGFMSEAERERRIDILNYQIKEITAANLSANEEQEIKNELAILSNSERISESLNICAEALNAESGAVSTLNIASRALIGISELSKKYSDISARLDSLYYELEDISFSIRDMLIESEFDPKRLDELETRLDVINSLKHKYGASIEAVLQFKAEAENELTRLTGSADMREKLLKMRDDTRKRYFEAAALLTAARRASAEKLCRLAEAQLRLLGMKKAELGAEFSTADGDIHPDGVDNVALLLSANAGEPKKPLSKVASGGELSRIMLALKTVITDADSIPTLIFDEVDTGISGNTANIVGQRMRMIAKKHQVLCVTHLPQIAAFADEHYLVEKHESDGRTITTLKRLSESEQAEELARIMGAEASSEAALTHARELIKKAKASL